MKRAIKEKGVTFTKEGDEIPDPTPQSIPVGFSVPRNWRMSLRDIVKQALNEEAEKNQKESWEEANDFNTGEEDDDIPMTQYEEHFDHEENFVEDMVKQTEINMKKEEKEKGAPNGAQPNPMLDSEQKVEEPKEKAQSAT